MNIYLSKQPTFLELLNHIEAKYEAEKSQAVKTQPKQDLFDIPELKINRFDMEEKKYKIN